MGDMETPLTPLPGEDAPLAMRYGGEPITPAEALGVARRLARLAADRGRTGRAATIPDALPPVDGGTTLGTYKLPVRLLAFVRAKAEMEERTVTDVVTEALEAYVATPPGARAGWTIRGR